MTKKKTATEDQIVEEKEDKTKDQNGKCYCDKTKENPRECHLIFQILNCAKVKNESSIVESYLDTEVAVKA